MIEDAARRADHDVGRMHQRVALRADGLAAAQGEDLNIAGKARQLTQHVADLIRQFARWAEHQRLSNVAAAVDMLQQANAERRRFAAAGFGLRPHVASRQDSRQRGGLNRRHLGVAHIGQIGDLAGGKIGKGSKCGHGRPRRQKVVEK